MALLIALIPLRMLSELRMLKAGSAGIGRVKENRAALAIAADAIGIALAGCLEPAICCMTTCAEFQICLPVPVESWPGRAFSLLWAPSDPVRFEV
jgi:hypothetical protein